MNQIRKLFEENKVLLWGEKKAPSSMLEEFNHGNKNPQSTARIKPKKEKEEVKEQSKPKKAVRKFSLEEDYGVQDLPFLNKEYDRLDQEMTGLTDMDKLDELGDLQEKLYDLIEGLERMKKMAGGKGINTDKPFNHNIKAIEEPIVDDDFLGASIMSLVGKGFKKGSPEALAHAQKMREALIAKKPPTVKKVINKAVSKARVEKGSEEAKALGKRLAEARKKKLEEAKKEKEEVKKEEVKKEEVKPTKGKPWYYIGDIPKGYREATEDEAVLAKKVSQYGKYEVDMTKWTLYRDYEMLLTDNKSTREAQWAMSGLKRRVLETLRDIEVMKAKIEKHLSDGSDSSQRHPTKAEFKSDLEELKEKRKYLQAGYNFYHRLICERTGKKYERQKIELPKIEIKPKKEEEEEKWEPPKPNIIDPRTGKLAEFTYKGEEKPIEEETKITDPELLFKKGDDTIGLSLKFFTPDYKLIPKYAKKLTEKNIFLNKKHYTKEDYEKYIYHKIGGGIYNMVGNGIVKRQPNKNKRNIVQSVIFDKDYWTKIEAKKWLKDNDYYNDDIDEKKDSFRFRQYNPEDLNDRKFRTKKLNNGLSLVLSIK